MATSEARIAANRLNCLKSCGPKSPETRAISRKNSLKHGLAGAGIVVAEKEAAEIEDRRIGFQVDFNPQTDIGKDLIRQMAIFSVRMDRSAKYESAAIASNVRNAVDAFDEARLDEADRLLDLLGENPRLYSRKLCNSPEGVEALIDAWQDLKADLTREGRPIWTATHRERAENLTGYRIENAGASRIAALSRAMSGDFYLLSDQEGGNLAEEARQAWARKEMIDLIDSRIVELAEHHESFDFEAIELDRREAPTRALFDPSREATLARRYVSEATRGFYRALKELKRVEEDAAVARIYAAKYENKPLYSPPLASSRDEAPTPREPRPTSPPPGVPTSDPAPKSADLARNGLERPSNGPA